MRVLLGSLALLLAAGDANAGGPVAVVAPDPAALLAPRDTLDPEVVIAAEAAEAAGEPTYLGAWAEEASECPLVDLDYDYEMFVVASPTQVQFFASLCSVEAQPLVDGKVELNGQCADEGEGGTFAGTVGFELLDSETLLADNGMTYARCHLSD